MYATEVQKLNGPTVKFYTCDEQLDFQPRLRLLTRQFEPKLTKTSCFINAKRSSPACDSHREPAETSREESDRSAHHGAVLILSDPVTSHERVHLRGRWFFTQQVKMEP